MKSEYTPIDGEELLNSAQQRQMKQNWNQIIKNVPFHFVPELFSFVYTNNRKPHRTKQTRTEQSTTFTHMILIKDSIGNGVLIKHQTHFNKFIINKVAECLEMLTGTNMFNAHHLYVAWFLRRSVYNKFNGNMEI